MDSIHAPTTVPSGPTSGAAAANGAGKDDLSLMDLIAERDHVEAELKALGSVLDSVFTLPSSKASRWLVDAVCTLAWR